MLNSIRKFGFPNSLDLVEVELKNPIFLMEINMGNFERHVLPLCPIVKISIVTSGGAALIAMELGTR